MAEQYAEQRVQMERPTKYAEQDTDYLEQANTAVKLVGTRWGEINSRKAVKIFRTRHETDRTDYLQQKYA